MNKKLSKLLKRNGWVMECESPLEVRHEDGSFATGQAAKLVIEDCKATSRSCEDCGRYEKVCSKGDAYFCVDDERRDWIPL
jgi:hypothetical protein